MVFLTPLVCAALLEWFLWLTAFLYCLWKVYKKADHWTVQVMAILNAIVFSTLRYIVDSTAVSLWY